MSDAGRNIVWRSPRNGRWYWRHVAANGRIDDAGEQGNGFASRRYARLKARRSRPDATTIVLPEGETP